MNVSEAIRNAQNLILSQQFADGYWWYTLEANDSILAEYLLFHRYMGISLEAWRSEGLIAHMIGNQRGDGSWAVYKDGPGSVGATTECYFALKLYGVPITHPAMEKAKNFILSQGGALKSWVFTRIHLAMFGILPWEAAPVMPPWLILLPSRSPLTIYEFSSWARASIVPLLIIMDCKKSVDCGIRLDELFPTAPGPKDWRFTTDKGLLSVESVCIQADRLLKRIPCPKGLRQRAIRQCEQWIVDHLMVTADIFPALAYGSVALYLLGHKPDAGALGKALMALKSFQQQSARAQLPAIPGPPVVGSAVYQQCCISPTWDTAWAGSALIDSGVDAPEALKRAGHWLLGMQILNHQGDWAIKNKGVNPGGWAFEFQNDAFPDIDDTVQIMQFLDAAPLPLAHKKHALERALDWVISMQSANGGWAAFDKDNTQAWVNRIPFSDHKACLDSPTADITARVLETLVRFGYRLSMNTLARGLAFVRREQTACGAWKGRWGVSYIYGSWCVLQGLAAAGVDPKEAFMQQALNWLVGVQRPDGGWSESCASDACGHYVPLPYSTASQTAWAVLALVACGLADSTACKRGVDYLLRTQNSAGGWDEAAYTGTGFPGHFYIRYHGYRHYFPLLALGRYAKMIST